MPTCSVIVCTRNRPRQLAECLASLRALRHGDFEVIVVENKPTPGEARAIASAATAQYVHEPHGGLSRARNTGARHGKGWLLAYLDDDSVAEPEWLNAHLAAMEDGPAATTGRIISRPTCPGADDYFDLGDSRLSLDRSHGDWFERANFGGLGFGGNMALRRELFASGFAFRESLGLGSPLPGGEEFHAFFRLLGAGHRVDYVPEAVVQHDAPGVAHQYKALERAGARRHAAYATLLFVEEPRYRRRVVRHIFEAFMGRPRPWRPAREARASGRLSLLGAASVGPLLYAKARATSRKVGQWPG